MKLLLFLIMFFLYNLSAKELLKQEGLQKIIQPKVSLQTSYLSDATLDGYDSSVEVVKNHLAINNEIVGFSYTNWIFQWNNLGDLPFGDKVHSPLKQMHSFQVNANIPYFINDKWFWLTSLSVKSTFEKETQNSYGAGLFSFASYKIDTKHAIQFGAFTNYHPISILALPVIGYSYRAKESDGFKFIFGFPRTYIAYHINEDILLRFGIIFSQSVIKLSQTSVIEQSGFIEVQDYMSNFGISYELNSNLSIEADILYSVKRNFTIYSKDGHELNAYSINPSLGANFKITYLF